MRSIVARILAVFFALTWVLFPGFGLADLQASWDPDWPVVLEASWGIFMTVLVGGAFLAVAVRPARAAPATVTLLVALAAMVVAAALGLELPLLGFAGFLAVQLGLLRWLLPAREALRPRTWRPWLPLLVVAALGVVPWLVHADEMFRLNRRDAGTMLDELTMGVDHHALQGGLAVALVALSLLAAGWPRGRRYLGVSVGLCAGYVGLVSVAFPREWAGFDPVWSWLCLAWGLAVAALAVLAPRSERGELRFQVVETERAL